MPKNQTTASKKARAAQRATGGKYTTHLREAGVCGQQIDPWGELPDTCARPPHAGHVHSLDPNFDAGAWDRATAEADAAAAAAWDAMTPEEQEESELRTFEEEHDDGRTASDDYEDARAYNGLGDQ
ncbi:hypothetical protein [Streptomyces sp. NPDC005407]|uniref:hypothetical protein n=1 Tax=Streptomyces sp. NPDC005407 TaxID=3155340 RepID=UPI0033AE73EE